jgi:hypothetical protein
MQMGIAAYLRNLTTRCNEIGRRTVDSEVTSQLARISAELADKAQVLEENFRIPDYRPRPF